MSSPKVSKVTLFIIAASSFITPFLASSVTTALKIIGADFSLSSVGVGWIVSSYLLSAAVFMVPVGKLADIHGQKIFFSTGCWIITVTSLICGLAPYAWLLIVGRIVQGIGAAMISTTSVAIISGLFSPEKRGKYLGITISSVYLGLTTGPFIGGLVTQYLGWRYLFLITVPIGLAITLMIHLGIPNIKPAGHNTRLDITGSILFGVALTCLLYGLSVLPALTGFFAIVIAALCLVLFVKREIKSSTPLLGIALLRQSSFAFSSLAALINYSATFAVTFIIALYLQCVKGFSPQYTGILLMCQPAVMTFVSPVAGRLSDYKEPRIISSAGMLLCVSALVILTLLTAGSPIIHVIIGLVVLGFGCGLFSAPNTAAVMSSVEKKKYGTASAFIAMMRIVGQMLSMAVAMLVLSIFTGTTVVSNMNVGRFLTSQKMILSVSAVLCFVGTFFSLSRGKIHGSRRGYTPHHE
jgi:EmrB/QacA subfamily drug resistance transporter